MLHRTAIAILCCLVLVPHLDAQQVVSVNSASYAHPDLPNGGIAQGSMFIGFGSGMGPASIAFPSPWPFPTELAGTSMQVTVGGQTVDCFMVYTVATQVAAILPSNTPLGDGTPTVTYNGSVAATGSITVVKHAFGVFALSQQGIGPIVATNPLSNPVAAYTTTNSAAPGDFIDIWGTGLGPVSFPDEGQTTVVSLGYDVQVYIGGVSIPVLYAGRSGCCSAIDLIRVQPAGLFGCFLPVTVVVDGAASNYTTISIDPDGGTCAANPTFGGPDFDELQISGTLRTGDVQLLRLRSPAPTLSLRVQSQDLVLDSVVASYQQYDMSNTDTFAGVIPISVVGACNVYEFNSENTDFPTLIPPIPLDAGDQLAITGPGGDDVVPRLGDIYVKSFFLPTVPFLTPETKQQITFPTYYEPGLTTVTAPGGTDVQGHMASITVPQDFVWTNREVASGSVSRNSPLPVEYSGSGYDYVSIFGWSAASINPEDIFGRAFHCIADPSAGSFTIPARVLMSLPDNPLVQGMGSGAIVVGGVKVIPFDAGGTDLNMISYADQTTQTGTDFN